MKALYLWDSEYPWDIRVEKICETLMENGWEVHLVCRNRHRKSVEDHYEGIFLHRISFLSQKLGKLNDIFTFPIFFSPIWLRRIYQVATEHKVDIIIARDLPMILAAILIGKIRRIPVILDMAECYPEMIRLIWKFEPFKIHNILVRNTIIVDFIERLALRLVDHIFVMVKESRQRLIKKNIPGNKITIVSNTPILKKFREANATFPGTLGQKKGNLTLLYVGFINYSRGLDTVIRSLQEYIKIDDKVYLVLLGIGTSENYLRKLTKELGLERFVGFEGWINNKLVPEYVASSDICLVPHHKCSHWDNTIPNKLFDYMATGKPVLVSDVMPMQRIVQQTNCGLVYRDYDNESFVSQLLQLRDAGLRKELGQNGIKAVQEYYNWDNDSAKMLKCLKEIVTR